MQGNTEDNLSQTVKMLVTANENLLDFTLGAIDGFVLHASKDWQTAWASPAFWHTLGYPGSDGKVWLDTVFEEDKNRYEEAVKQLQASPAETVDLAVRHWHKNGSVCHFSLCALAAAHGSEAYVLARFEMLKREGPGASAFHETPALDYFFDMGHNLMIIVDYQGTICKVNSAWTDLLGYSIDDYIGKPLVELVHPDDVAAMQAALGNLQLGQAVWDFVNRYRASNGTYRYLEWRGKPHGDLYYAVAKDITRQVIAEQEAKISLQRNEALLRLLPDALLLMDRHGYYKEILVNFPESSPSHVPSAFFAGKHIREVLGEKHALQLLALVPDLKTEGGPATYLLDMPINGQMRYFELRILAYIDDLVLVISRDITDLQNASEMLEQKEAMLSNITKSLPGLILRYVLHPDGHDEVLFISEGVAKLYEVTVEDALSNIHLIWSKIHPEDVADMVASIQSSASSLSNWQYTWRAVLASGEVKWIFGQGTPEDAGNGAIIWNTLLLDVTGQKNAQLDLIEKNDALAATEEELRANLEELTIAKEEVRAQANRLEMIIQATRLGTWDWHIQSGATYYNQLWASMLGYSLDELTTHAETFMNLLHPDDYPKFVALLEDMAQGKITFFQEEIRMKAKDGSWKWILDTGKLLEVDADGKGLRAVGIHQDITDLRETEQDLLRVKELLEQTNRAARVGGWEIDFENRTVYWSDITREIHQIGPDYQDADTFEGILAQRFAFYKEGESRERIQQAIASAAAQGSSFDEELQLVTALGKEIWVRVVGKAIQLKGKVAKIYGAIYDISPLKKAANELEKKLTILKQAEAIANMGSWEYNFVENTLFWSDEVYKICGYEPRAFEVTFEIGMSVIHPDDQPHTVKTFEHTIATGAPYNMEKRFVRPDGSIRFINSRGRLVYDDKGKPFSLIGIFLDITEQKQITQQLEQLIDTTKSQNNRLIEYTHITSHNLRSPVARLMGLCALLTSDPSNQQYLNMVTQSANDLDSMIRLLNDLLDIENEVAYEEKMLVPLLPIIENNVNSLVPTCPDPLHIDIQVPPELSVSVIPLYLESIVHNLVSNAIKYRKSNQACSIVIQAHNHDDFVCLTISDNGIGINMEQHGDRLFKLKSRLSNYAEGKGIGLFFTKRQVEAMGGRIEVESQPGMGTTFKVYFSQRDVQIDDPE